MAITQVTPSGFVEDIRRGLIVPQKEMIGGEWSGGFDFSSSILDRFNLEDRGGVRLRKTGAWLDRDEGTGILNIPPYASGLDDLLNRAIVGGYVANVGYSGVIDPMLSALVTKLANMAGTWSPMVTGRRLARQRAIEAIHRANDSDFGPGEFMRQIAAGFFIDNRGVAFAQMPIQSIPFDNWAERGMTAVPVDGSRGIMVTDGRKQIPQLYYMQPTNRELRRARMLETVDVLSILPTGIKEWPYWIRKKVKGAHDYVWVLIPRLVGGHITLTSQPANHSYPTYGQSGTWRYISMLVKDILVEDEMVEAFMYGPPEGIVWGTGLDSQTQLKEALIQHHKDKEDAKVSYYPGVIFGGSEAENARIFMLRWRQQPDGFSASEWKARKEDVLAQSMWASIGQLAQRPGEGIATQALIGWDAQSEALFAAVRQLYETIFNWVAVDATVRMIWKSDRSKRSQAETAEILAKAISGIQKAFDNEVEKPFTAQEVRSMWEQQTGIDVPSQTGEVENEMFSRIDRSFVPRDVFNKLPVVDWYAAGDSLALWDSGIGIVEEFNSNSGLVRVKTLAESAVVLVPAKSVRLIKRHIDPAIIEESVRFFDEFVPSHKGLLNRRVYKTDAEIGSILDELEKTLLEVYTRGLPPAERLYHAVATFILLSRADFSTNVLAEVIHLTNKVAV